MCSSVETHVVYFVSDSERADPAYCRDRLTEGSNINKSLVTLGIVISALGNDSGWWCLKYENKVSPSVIRLLIFRNLSNKVPLSCCSPELPDVQQLSEYQQYDIWGWWQHTGKPCQLAVWRGWWEEALLHPLQRFSLNLAAERQPGWQLQDNHDCKWDMLQISEYCKNMNISWIWFCTFWFNNKVLHLPIKADIDCWIAKRTHQFWRWKCPSVNDFFITDS